MPSTFATDTKRGANTSRIGPAIAAISTESDNVCDIAYVSLSLSDVYSPQINNNQPLRDLSEARPEAVCAWCTPRAELDRLNAKFPSLSHGICPSCEVLFLAGVKP